MQIFTGVDIIEIARFSQEQLQNTRFMNLCFTKDEQEYCFSKTNPDEHFAGRYAAKEAMTKALTGFNKTLVYSQIEIKCRDNGRPYIVLHTTDEDIQKVKIDVSISHSKTDAVAFVVVYC